MLLSEVKAEARLVSGNEPRYFFATRSKQTINFPVAVRWHLTRHVHARKARRWLPSPDIVFTPSQKQEMVRKLTDAMVALEGENMRQVTFVVIDEVKSGGGL